LIGLCRRSTRESIPILLRSYVTHTAELTCHALCYNYSCCLLGSSHFYDTLIKHVVDVRTGDKDRWDLVEVTITRNSHIWVKKRWREGEKKVD